MEKEFEVEPYGVKYTCDSCGEGEMLPNNDNSFAYQIKIGHTCTKCGEKIYLDEKYPLIRFRNL